MSGLLKLNGLEIMPRSVVEVDGAEIGLAHGHDGPRLAILVPSGSSPPPGLHGERSLSGGSETLLLCPTDAGNLDVLRGLLPWHLESFAGLGRTRDIREEAG